MDVELPDGQVITGVPEGTTKRQLYDKLAASKSFGPEVLKPLRADVFKQEAQAEAAPLKDAPWLKRAGHVAGSTLHSTGQALAGIPRLFGADIGPNEEDVEKLKAKRAALAEITPGATAIEIATDLASTGWIPGVGVAGTAAKLGSRVLPKAAAAAAARATAATPGTGRALAKTLADRAATGALISGATTAGDWEDRALSGALGAGGSVALPVLGMGGRQAGKYLGRRASIAGDIAQDMGAPQARALAAQLADPAEAQRFANAGVMRPTAAQLTGNAQLRDLEIGSRVNRGDLYAPLDEAAASGRWERLGHVAQDDAALAAAQAERKRVTDPLRTGALARARAGQAAHEPDLTHRLELVVNDILQGEARTNPQAARLANWVRGELEQGVTPEQLYTMRKTLTSGIQPGNDISAAASFARKERSELINAIDEGLTLASGGRLGPKGARGGAWDPYMQEYQRLSQPVTSMRAGQAIREAFEGAGGRTVTGDPVITSGKLRNALAKHGEKDIGGRTFQRVTQQERRIIEDIAHSIERSDAAKQAQGMIGSRTAGNEAAADRVNDLLLASGGGFAGALADDAGIGGIGGGAVLALGGRRLNRAMTRRREQALASLLQDPARLRQALLVALRNQERGAAVTRLTSPGLRESSDLLTGEEG